MRNTVFEKPLRINWKIIAGGELHPIQMYDICFDEHDMRIRQLTEKQLDDLQWAKEFMDKYERKLEYKHNSSP